MSVEQSLQNLSLRADILAETYGFTEGDMPKGYRDFTGAIHALVRGGTASLKRVMEGTANPALAGEAASTFKFYKPENPASFFRDASNYFTPSELEEIYPALGIAQKITSAEATGTPLSLNASEIDQLQRSVDIIEHAAEDLVAKVPPAAQHGVAHMAENCIEVSDFFRAKKAEYNARFGNAPGGGAPGAPTA
jgi:hypothetical protein